MSSRLRGGLLCAVASSAIGTAAPAGEDVLVRIDCPDRILYRFQFSSGALAAPAEGNWDVKLRRTDGERTVELPKLYVRGDQLVCEYQLPNGAFAQASRNWPEAAGECTAGADDALSVPYFACR